MLANLGLWSQAAITKKGPLENLSDHLADPGHNNSMPLSLFHALCLKLLGFCASLLSATQFRFR